MKNRKLLMIPGPIEFDLAVLAVMSIPTTSHVATDFIEIFGQALEKTRHVPGFTPCSPLDDWFVDHHHYRSNLPGERITQAKDAH